MASLAGLRELCLHVVRIRRALIVLQVAGHARRGRQVVVAVHVALRAGQRLMRSGERKSYRAVVKSRRLPRGCVVAGLAGLGEGQRDVIGIRALLIVGQMTAHAVGGRAFKSSSRMAGIAVERGVGADQGKSRELQVVELGPEPVVHAVALLAAGRKTAADVVRFGGLKVLRMARIALRWKSLELAHRGALVARSTIQGRMRTHQGKAILVLVDLLYGDLPSLYACGTARRKRQTAACEYRHGSRRTSGPRW